MMPLAKSLHYERFNSALSQMETSWQTVPILNSRTKENDYELKGAYITDADGKIKEGPYQYDARLMI